MSAFLGKVHYWMYNKIKLVVLREEWICREAAEICGDLAQEGQEIVRQTYGQPLPDRDLSELIDHGNIHGWLQKQLTRAECREAAFVNWLNQSCGLGTDWLQQVYERQAQDLASRIKSEGSDPQTAQALYDQLQDVQLNGMPCDAGNQVIYANDEKVVWQMSQWCAESSWLKAEADPKLMKTLYKAWTKAFIEALNSGYTVAEQEAGFEILPRR